jgi:hypothetical protein
VTLLYRGHPHQDFCKTEEKRGLSFSEDEEMATNYARDFFRRDHNPSFVTTVELHDPITISDENVFRGPESFNFLVNRYSKHTHVAVKTRDGKLVVIFKAEKLKIIRVKSIDASDIVLSKEKTLGL